MSDGEKLKKAKAAYHRALSQLGGASKSPKKRAASAANGRIYGGAPVRSGVPADIAAQLRARYPGVANQNLRDKLRRIYLRDGVLPELPAPRRTK